MNAPRRGAGGRAGSLAGSVAAAVRRRQQEREPRVVVFDRAGHPRVLPPGAPGYDGLLEVGEELIRTATAKR